MNLGSRPSGWLAASTRLLGCLLLWLGGAATLAADAGRSAGANGSPYSIGVYYYPGWRTDAETGRTQWTRIQPYPEREPLAGWYDESQQAVIDQQLQWMRDYGIKFVVFDWYWTNGHTRIQHALNNYMRSNNKKLVEFSIMWANHENHPKSKEDFDKIVQYWIDHFLADGQYQRIDGMPVVQVFSPKALEQKAQAFGSTAKELLAGANDAARQAGLGGIYFTGGAPAGAFAATEAKAAGYRALTAYNYSAGRTFPLFDSFPALDRGYREHWAWILDNSPLPYFLPISSGWDRRPWGGSKDPRRDLSVSTPDTFETHLRAAKAMLDDKPAQTNRTAIICCWNEYGEGSYIEPTKQYGMQYLERVKRVFAN